MLHRKIFVDLKIFEFEIVILCCLIVLIYRCVIEIFK